MAGHQGVIMSFTRAKRSQDSRTAIIDIDDVKDRVSAAKLVGHKVTWTRADGLVFRGTIHAPHGSGGSVLARFRRQLPPDEFPIRVVIA